MTGIKDGKETLSVFGWELEKRTSVQGAIQTVLLLASLVAAPFFVYYGFTKQLSDLERAQAATTSTVEDLTKGISGELQTLKVRVEGLNSRMNAQETSNAVAAAVAARTQTDIAGLTAQIDDLDKFLRNYISKDREK